jgi:hyperosmotically inducible protein
MTRTLAAVAALFITLGTLSSASAQTLSQDERLALFKAAQREVLGYSQFGIFDSVHARVGDNGVIELTGKVTMPYKRTAIERRVSRAAGIRGLVNRIEVLPVSQFDDRLRLQIARALYSNPHFIGYGHRANPPVHIIVEHGRVTLDGVVNSNVDRMLARSIASSFLSLGPINVQLKTNAEAREEMEKI